MDINTIRGLATVVALIAFLSVIFWAYSSRRKKDFDEAAALPFADDMKEADSNREMTENSQTRGVKRQ
ncbi:MAG: cbb3-type cytochrome oxidase subunit 3 [Endozoicomonas sp.]